MESQTAHQKPPPGWWWRLVTKRFTPYDQERARGAHTHADKAIRHGCEELCHESNGTVHHPRQDCNTDRQLQLRNISDFGMTRMTLGKF